MVLGDGLNKTIVLIPTFNEARGIGPTIKEIVEELGKTEIIVVDQNSPDGTAQIATSLGAKVITQLGRGKGAAIAEGLLHVRKVEPMWLVMCDGDNQCPARYIPQMINILRERPDVGMVSGWMYAAYVERYTLWKRIKWVYLDPFVFMHRMLVLLHHILNGINMRTPLSGQRVIRYESIRDFQPKAKDFDIEIETNCYIQKKGYKILEIPVVFRYRLGRTKFWRFKHGLIILRRMVIEALG